MTSPLKLILKYRCSFCVECLKYVTHFYKKLHVLCTKVITAHLSMLPGSSKNLRIIHCGIDCNSDVALLASFCAMSPQ